MSVSEMGISEAEAGRVTKETANRQLAESEINDTIYINNPPTRSTIYLMITNRGIERIRLVIPKLVTTSGGSANIIGEMPSSSGNR